MLYQKVTSAFNNAGFEHFYYHPTHGDPALFHMVHLMKIQAVFEASPEFVSMDEAERGEYQKICDSIETGIQKLQETFGPNALEQVKLEIALQLAYPFISRTKDLQSRIEITGLHEFQHLPSQYFETVKGKAHFGHFHINKWNTDPKLINCYKDVFARLEEKDASIPPVIYKALSHLKTDPIHLNETLDAFVGEYKALCDRCADPLTIENQAFILNVLPAAKRPAVADALSFFDNFPKTPNRRDCDRYYNLVLGSHDESDVFPAFPEKADTLTSAMYYAMKSEFLFADTPRIQAIRQSVKAMHKSLPEGTVCETRTLNPAIEYFTIGFEKIAYAGKLEAYRQSKQSKKERVDEYVDRAMDRYSRYDAPRFPRAVTTQHDKDRFDTYFANKAAFESIQEAVLYDETPPVSVDTVRRAHSYLETLKVKTVEVVEAVRNSKPEADIDEDDYSYDAPPPVDHKDLGAGWRRKLETVDLPYGYRSVNAYINKLPEYTKTLEALEKQVLRLESRLENVRDKAIATTSYDETNLLIVNKVPKQLKEDQSDRIDQDAANELQTNVNNKMAGMKKTYFSVLEKPPLVKIDAKKNKLIISIESLNEKDIIPGMLKLFSGNQTRIDEALSNGKAGVLKAVKDALKQQYRFLADSDFVTPQSRQTGKC